MALADPQSVTIAGVTSSLPNTGNDRNSSEYTSADGNVKLSVSHAYGNRTRRVVRLDQQKVAADPLLTGVYVRAKQAAYVVIDVPLTGFTAVETKDLVVALTTALTASSNALITKVTGGEH